MGRCELTRSGIVDNLGPVMHTFDVDGIGGTRVIARV